MAVALSVAVAGVLGWVLADPGYWFGAKFADERTLTSLEGKAQRHEGALDALELRLQDLRGGVSALRESDERYRDAIENLCSAFRSARRLDESEYVVVVMRVLADACDGAKVPSGSP